MTPKKVAVLLTHGLLPHASYKDAMRNFKESPLNPTKPDAAAQKANPRGIKDWNQEMERAKFAYVRDTPFPKQDKALMNGELHRLLSCLYYHEVARLDQQGAHQKKETETKGPPSNRAKK